MSTDLRTGRFAAHGLTNIPPDTVREVLGHRASDTVQGSVLNWLHRETYVAQGQAVAMNLCDAMTGTLDPPGLLYDGSPPAALDVSAAAYDPVGDLHLLAVHDGTNYSVRLSDDGLLSTSEALAAAAGIRIEGLAIVPGEWVFASRNNSKIGRAHV